MPGQGSVFRIRRRGPDGEVVIRWRAQVSIGGRSHRRFVTRTVPTEREALDALDELRAERRAGVTRSRLTTGAFLEQWVETVRNIRPATRAGYRSVIRHHLVPLLGDIRLDQLRPLHVEEMLARLEPRMSPKQLRNVHAVLRRALTYAVRSGFVAVNVASREYVDTPRVASREPDALTALEVRRLLEAVRGDRLEALFVAAVGTGLRQGELLGLAWEDVDLEGAVLHVRCELQRIEGVYRRVDPKTPESRRSVPLSPAVVDALREHRRRTIDEGFVPTATGPVFTNRGGGPLNGSWVTHHFYALLARAGLRRAPFKILRATFSSRLYEAGVPEVEIARLMGHTRTHTTKRHYIALAGRSATALEAIERLVG